MTVPFRKPAGLDYLRPIWVSRFQWSYMGTGQRSDDQSVGFVPNSKLEYPQRFQGQIQGENETQDKSDLTWKIAKDKFNRVGLE